jgi:hypothetical protein
MDIVLLSKTFEITYINRCFKHQIWTIDMTHESLRSAGTTFSLNEESEKTTFNILNKRLREGTFALGYLAYSLMQKNWSIELVSELIASIPNVVLQHEDEMLKEIIGKNNFEG